MDSSKIISLDDLTKEQNRYPGEIEALGYALQLCDLLQTTDGNYPLLTPGSIYVENGNHWALAHPPQTTDASEALFRLGAVLHYLLTRNPFHISHYLDGPPPIRERNPQISVRFESIVNRLLQNIRAQRYATVEGLREDLERLKKEITGEWKIIWPSFKGSPSRTNALSDAAFLPEGKTLKETWIAEIGEIWASPLLAGDYVFAPSGDGNFYALDCHTGKVAWKLFLGARIESTPCIDQDVAYLGNDIGTFYAINIRNGTIIWKKALGEYVRSSAIVDKSNIYVGSINATQKTGTFWCLSKNGGTVVWKKAMGPVFSSAVLDRNELIIGSDDERLYCFTTAGVEKWRLALAGKIRSSAAAIKDFIYAGGFGGVLYKIRRTTGEIAWRNSEAGAMYSSPGYARSFVVAGNNAGSVCYFQVNGGKKIAQFETHGPVTSSPLTVSQYVLIGSNDGHFYILDPRGALVTSFDAHSPINSSAVYEHNTIYVGSDRGLHALSL